MKIKLPYKDDFLLDLQNNNYSLETVYNYGRDLLVFEVFLNLRSITFKKIDKRFITLYKGFLRTNNYLSQITDYLYSINDENLTKFKFFSSNKISKKDNFISHTSTKNKNISSETNLTANSKLNKAKNFKKNFDITNTQSLKSKTNTHLQNNKPLSPRSVNRMLTTIRRYIKYLDEFDLVKPLPITVDSIKLIKTEKKSSQVAELDELIKLIEFPTEYEKNELIALRNRAILELLFSSGLRISELIRLEKQDLNSEGKIYIQGKGKKQRFIYITPRAKFHINNYLNLRGGDNNPSLFAPTRGGSNGSINYSISPNYIQERIATYRKLLGIIVPTSPHSFRHGFATYLAQEGASPAAIQILLGHESLQTTDKYLHASDKFAEDTHKRFHPLYK